MVKTDIVDYALLILLVVLVIGYSFGLIPDARVEGSEGWIRDILVAFGFKKIPQVLGTSEKT